MSQDRPLNNAELLSVLDWYRAAGVDLAVVDEPVDRFAQKPPAASIVPQRAAQPAPAVAPPPQPSGPIGGDPAEARQLAASAQSLDQLRVGHALALQFCLQEVGSLHFPVCFFDHVSPAMRNVS